MRSVYGTKQSGGPSLAVIGGGLAGIAAAEAALRKGFHVDLFEWSRVLGGRAGSLFEPSTGQWIDSGQHVALGCCKELLALHARLGLDDLFLRHDTIPFANTDGKRWILAASPLLPNRWQLVPALLKMPFLSLRDRLATGLLIRKLATLAKKSPNESERISFADWLAAKHASPKAVLTFWSPLIYSTLCETNEHVSLAAVQKVVQDGFLSGKEAMSLHLPKVPLRTIYHEETSQRLQKMGVRLHFLSRVHRLQWEFSESDREGHHTDSSSEKSRIPRVIALELGNGSMHSFDHYIMATPAFRTWKILQESGLEDYTEQLGLDRFEPGAITTVHLWFNRRLLPPNLPYTALLGGSGQFLCCPQTVDTNKTVSSSAPTHLEEATGEKFQGTYHTVVISASHRLLSESELTSKDRASLVNDILCQICKTFPGTFQEQGTQNEEAVRLLHFRVTTYFDAVFSPSPSVYLERPLQQTPFSNFALAGDWTQTGWPSTMEGAVLSGQAAVAALGVSH